MTTSAILLCGGAGRRFGGEIPKVLITLADKAVALWSFEKLLASDAIDEIVVVCHEDARSLFSSDTKRVAFALPGRERQDSVFHGMLACHKLCNLYCIHDGARPFVSVELIDRVVAAAREHGAAVAGVPAKQTIKVADDKGFVKHTPCRSTLWEIQTPQAVAAPLLQRGFAHIQERGLTVTDDASVVEHLGEPVKLVESDYSNIKITTPDDMALAKAIAAQELSWGLR